MVTFLAGIVGGGSGLARAYATEEAPPVQAPGQTLRFGSRQLADLYERLRLDARSLDSVLRSADTTEWRYASDPPLVAAPIRILTDGNQTVFHIGYQLFDDASRLPDPEVGHFIERRLLEYTMWPGAPHELIQSDNVEIVHRGRAYVAPQRKELQAIIRDIRGGQAFHLARRDYQFRVSIDTDDAREAVILVFPARTTLIFGQSKPEMDSVLVDRLLRLPDFTSRRTLSPRPDGAVPFDGDIIRQPGDVLSPGLTSDQYFRKAEDTYLTLRDPAFPRETIASLFQAPRPDDLERLHIVHQTYETPHPGYDVSLASFIHFMQQDHLVYSGFEPGPADTVRVAVVFRNTRYDHVHLLQLSWPVADIGTGRTIPLNGMFFSYIRWDNVRHLFADQ